MEVVKLFWALYNISMQHFFRVGLLEQPATRGGRVGLTLREALKTYKPATREEEWAPFAMLTSPESHKSIAR